MFILSLTSRPGLCADIVRYMDHDIPLYLPIGLPTFTRSLKTYRNKPPAGSWNAASKARLWVFGVGGTCMEIRADPRPQTMKTIATPEEATVHRTRLQGHAISGCGCRTLARLSQWYRAGPHMRVLPSCRALRQFIGAPTSHLDPEQSWRYRTRQEYTSLQCQ